MWALMGRAGRRYMQDKGCEWLAVKYDQTAVRDCLKHRCDRSSTRAPSHSPTAALLACLALNTCPVFCADELRRYGLCGAGEVPGLRLRLADPTFERQNGLPSVIQIDSTGGGEVVRSDARFCFNSFAIKSTAFTVILPVPCSHQVLRRVCGRVRRQN